jgi:uncharacterized membrane protein YbhN (UPF0104 family)
MARPWRLVGRAALLLATGVSLYLLAPTLLELFSSWPALKELEPLWLLLGLLFEATSFLALWEVERIALRLPSWFAVGTAQLTANAAGSIVPGGAATAGAFAYRMLVRAGAQPGDVAAGWRRRRSARRRCSSRCRCSRCPRSSAAPLRRAG